MIIEEEYNIESDELQKDLSELKKIAENLREKRVLGKLREVKEKTSLIERTIEEILEKDLLKK